MRLKSERWSLGLLSLTILVLVSSSASAQDPIPKIRLRSPAVVRGGIGGEAHDSYVIRARKGQRMTVQISWRREGENQANFGVSTSPDFYSGESLRFGRSSSDGRRWTGRIPRTGNYYIYVTAHPSADYTLRVRIR